MRRGNSLKRVDVKMGSLASVAAILLAVGLAHSQTPGKEFTKVSGRQYLSLCALTENARPCLQAIYTMATVNRLVDAIKNQKTFCPPASNAFPPDDIVSLVAAWLRAHPALLEKPSDEALTAALVAMYPCR